MLETDLNSCWTSFELNSKITEEILVIVSLYAPRRAPSFAHLSPPRARRSERAPGVAGMDA